MDSVTTTVATVKDVADLHEFMIEEFLRDPSLKAAINLQRDDVDQIYFDCVVHCVDSGVSTVHRNSKCRVVGCNLSAIVDHGEDEDWSSPTRIQLILDLVDVLNANKWPLFPSDVEKLLYVEILCVAEKYRNRGLAQNLLNISYDMARGMGVRGAYAESTSFKSQNLFAKTGYRVLREIRLDKFIGVDGKPIFVCPDGTTAVQLVFRSI